MPTTPELWRNLGQDNQTVTDTSGKAQNDQQIAQLDDGNIVVIWTSDTDVRIGGPTGTNIIGRVYDSLGNALGAEFLINSNSDSDECSLSVTALPGGWFVVAWQVAAFDKLRFRLFDNNGVAQGPGNTLVGSDELLTDLYDLCDARQTYAKIRLASQNKILIHHGQRAT